MVKFSTEILYGNYFNSFLYEGLLLVATTAGNYFTLKMTGSGS